MLPTIAIVLSIYACMSYLFVIYVSCQNAAIEAAAIDITDNLT